MRWLAEPRLGCEASERRLVDLNSASWNQLTRWLRQISGLLSVHSIDEFRAQL
jgi:hypothetical protein